MSAAPSTGRLVRSAAALVVAALVAVGCGGGEDDPSAATTTSVAPTTEAPTTTTTTTTAPPVEPLTGEPVQDEAVLSRPALVVKVDDTAKALGRQQGLDVADLVFAERVEGGAVRLAAVLHSTPGTVGPVRSARTTDLGITGNLGRPLFAYSGANSGVLAMVRGHNLVDLGYDAARELYAVRGSGVLRFFVDAAALFALAPPDAGPPPQQLRYRAPGAPVANAGAEAASGVTIRYPGYSGPVVRYLDEAEGWARVQDGVPHTVANGTRIAPENVIVQFVTYHSSGFVDVTGAPSPEAGLVGEGDAWVLTGGSLIRARWARPDLGALTTFTDAAGQPVLLEPGSTWIELADPGTATLG